MLQTGRLGGIGFAGSAVEVGDAVCVLEVGMVRKRVIHEIDAVRRGGESLGGSCSENDNNKHNNKSGFVIFY